MDVRGKADTLLLLSDSEDRIQFFIIHVHSCPSVVFNSVFSLIRSIDAEETQIYGHAKSLTSIKHFIEFIVNSYLCENHRLLQ